MQARIVETARGARWLAEGWRLFRAAPLGWLAAAGALYLPVMLAFWFAPPLASWHATGAAKALFFSLAASMMNWRAFLAYGAVMAVVTVLVPFLIVSAFALAGAAAPPAAALIFPLAIVMLPTLFASFYASYRDVFGYDAAP